jgi:transposase-like protein
MPGRTYTPEFKLSVVKDIQSGARRPAQVCREHNIAESVVLRWRQAYAEKGEAAFAPPREGTLAGKNLERQLEERVAELERLCGQLSLENSVLKRALELSRRGGGSK